MDVILAAWREAQFRSELAEPRSDAANDAGADNERLREQFNAAQDASIHRKRRRKRAFDTLARLRMILPKIRDPRFITIRRGGRLTDEDHRLLATWASECAEHILHHFESARASDERPRRAVELGRAWARGEVTWAIARTAAGHANGAARDLTGAPRFAAYAAAQAAAVGHVAAHELGAAAYAIRAVWAAASSSQDRVAAGRGECAWQRQQLPEDIRDLVLDDQRQRNELCWFAFDC